MDGIRVAWTAGMVLALVPFVDSMRLTRGQRYVTERTRERLALLGIEAALVALWAVLRWGLGWDRPLLPAGLQTAGAALGLVLSLAGAGLAAWAKARLGPWFTGTFGVKPGHELVTDGPYAVTRHPLYTGVVAAFAGSALVWDSRLTLALAVAVVAPLWRHTVIEERLFVAHFGEAYRRYQRRVPRMVPFAIRPRENA